MHPILFSIGEFYIGTYGLLVAVGLLAGTGAVLWRAKRLGLDADRLVDVVFLAVLGGIVGGRIAYVGIDLTVGERHFLAHPLEIVFSRTGFVFLGGVVFAALACAWYVRRTRLNAWLVGDVLFGALPLAHFFGRIGCFLAGCCYGKVVGPDSAWSFLAVRYPRMTTMGEAVYPGLAYADHLNRCPELIDRTATVSLPVWPVQLFEAAGNLAIFFALALLWRRRRFNGQVFLSYIVLYAVLRFGLEFLRGDVERGGFGVLSTSQAISAAGLIFAFAAWPFLRKRQALARVEAGPNRNRETAGAEPKDGTEASRKDSLARARRGRRR